MNKNMYLGALQIQKMFQKAGYQTAACGGFVRDYVLNKEANDIDLATVATPNEMEEIFFDNHIMTLPTGIKHGTITAILIVDGSSQQYEITTLRRDVSCDGRHADVVFTKSFEEDANRRDFTINALYMDLDTGEILDYVDGRKDIENRIIRFVGNPEDRIKEDYLRILRLFRFEAQLGFDVDLKAADIAFTYILDGYLSFVSIERIRAELLKILIGKYCYLVLNNRNALICNIIPELLPAVRCKQNCKHHDKTVYDHTIAGLIYLQKLQDPILSLAFLLHDIGKPFVKTTDENGIDHFYGHHETGARIAVRRVCYNLRLSSKQTRRIEFIVKNHMKLHLLKSKKSLRNFVNNCNEFSPTMLKDMCYICIADHYGMKKEYFQNGTDIVKKVLEIKKEMDSVVYSPLSGNDIIKLLGIKPGPIIGKIKNHLIQKVISSELNPNSFRACLCEAKVFLESLGDRGSCGK